jgi:hypothetical protein
MADATIFRMDTLHQLRRTPLRQPAAARNPAGLSGGGGEAAWLRRARSCPRAHSRTRLRAGWQPDSAGLALARIRLRRRRVVARAGRGGCGVHPDAGAVQCPHPARRPRRTAGRSGRIRLHHRPRRVFLGAAVGAAGAARRLPPPSVAAGHGLRELQRRRRLAGAAAAAHRADRAHHGRRCRRPRVISRRCACWRRSNPNGPMRPC